MLVVHALPAGLGACSEVRHLFHHRPLGRECSGEKLGSGRCGDGDHSGILQLSFDRDRAKPFVHAVENAQRPDALLATHVHLDCRWRREQAGPCRPECSHEGTVCHLRDDLRTDRSIANNVSREQDAAMRFCGYNQERLIGNVDTCPLPKSRPR